MVCIFSGELLQQAGPFRALEMSIDPTREAGDEAVAKEFGDIDFGVPLEQLFDPFLEESCAFIEKREPDLIQRRDGYAEEEEDEDCADGSVEDGRHEKGAG